MGGGYTLFPGGIEGWPDGNSMILGQSLNGIAKKQSFIIAVGQDIRTTMESAFNVRWKAANLWR